MYQFQFPRIDCFPAREEPADGPSAIDVSLLQVNFNLVYKTCLQSLSTSKDLPPTDQDRFVIFLKHFLLLKLGCVHTDACKILRRWVGVYGINDISGAKSILSSMNTVCVCHACDDPFVNGYG